MPDSKNYDDVDDPYRAIRIGEAGAASEATKWGYLLTLFMRVMAAFWMLQGLAQWYALLIAPYSIFDTTPKGGALAVIFFGVLDLVAGVGLWLATPWGGVLWLLIASAQIFVASSLPALFAGGYLLVVVDLILIGLYFWLTYEAGADFEGKRLIQHRRRRKTSPYSERLAQAEGAAAVANLDPSPGEALAAEAFARAERRGNGPPSNVIQSLKNKAAKATKVK